MRGSVFQNVTVTLFAPLNSIAPWFFIPFMLLQKIPIGWSWIPWNNQHWWCAFVGNSGFTAGDTITFPNGQQLISCPGGWLRWNPAYSWFWSYAMIMFWLIVPTLFWLKPRMKQWMARIDRKRNGCAGAFCEDMTCPNHYTVPEDGPCCEGGDMCHGECAECSKCGREFCKGDCK